MPSYAVTILTAVLVLAVAVFATYVRDRTFELQQIEETAGQTDPYFGGVPPELAQTQADADEKAAADSRSTKSTASRSTFILLAIVFVFLQILGVLFGSLWGFAGHESKTAYRLSGGRRFQAFDEFQAHYFDRVADRAQTKLEALRQLKGHRNEYGGNTPLTFTRKSFRDYVEDDYAKKRARRAADFASTIPGAVPTLVSMQHAAAPTRASPLVPPPPPPNVSVPPVRKYYFTDASNTPSASPVTLRELEQMLAAGTISPSSWTIEEGQTSWIALNDLFGSAPSVVRTSTT